MPGKYRSIGPSRCGWPTRVGIQRNAVTPIPEHLDDRDYHVPFRFTCKLNKLPLQIEQHVPTPADEKLVRE